MAQFGIHGNPKMAAIWSEKKMKDDPTGVQTNAPYTVSFATSGADTRTTQMFINFVDNSRLDDMGKCYSKAPTDASSPPSINPVPPSLVPYVLHSLNAFDLNNDVHVYFQLETFKMH